MTISHTFLKESIILNLFHSLIPVELLFLLGVVVEKILKSVIHDAVV